jgi:GntR family transcriptional regulator, transcriptional repressor for pyruvate dehydrogenase complex
LGNTVTLEPLSRKSLSQEVRDRIIALIRSGLKPGDKLPTERELMAQLNVGRSSVREAMRGLLEVGVLEMRPGSGAHVANIVNATTLNSLSLAMCLPDDPRIQLLEARQVIEVACAELAAERATESDLQAMDEQLGRYDEALAHDDLAGMVAADLAFHGRIMEATRNPVFLRMVSPVNELLADARARSLDSSEVQIESRERHRALFEAIQQHDAATACAAMRRHLMVLR